MNIQRRASQPWWTRQVEPEISRSRPRQYGKHNVLAREIWQNRFKRFWILQATSKSCVYDFSLPLSVAYQSHPPSKSFRWCYKRRNIIEIRPLLPSIRRFLVIVQARKKNFCTYHERRSMASSGLSRSSKPSNQDAYRLMYHNDAVTWQNTLSLSSFLSIVSVLG